MTDAVRYGGSTTPRTDAESLAPLNPEWVEWLMGWPIGWTALDPLVEDRLKEWLRAFPSATRD